MNINDFYETRMMFRLMAGTPILRYAKELGYVTILANMYPWSCKNFLGLVT